MKKKIVSVCLTAMLVGGLSMTSMQEARAAEGKVIDGSELTQQMYRRRWILHRNR